MSLSAADTAALIALSVAWLVLAARLILDTLGYKPQGLTLRLVEAGLLVMCTGALITQFAATRQWPLSQRLVLDKVNMVLVLAGGACIVIGTVARVRSRHRQP
ncbi:MAG: hypothetical protein ACM3ML_19630 [Micromonosporaceae bacterium]